MTDQKLLGGQLGFYGIQPFVDVRLSAAGFSDSNKGLGDFVFAPLLAWHHGNPRWGHDVFKSIAMMTNPIKTMHLYR